MSVVVSGRKVEGQRPDNSDIWNRRTLITKNMSERDTGNDARYVLSMNEGVGGRLSRSWCCWQCAWTVVGLIAQDRPREEDVSATDAWLCG